MNKLETMLSKTLMLGAALAVFPAQAAPAHAVKNVVLVHGAFADGSGWKAVSAILVKDGYKVSIAQPPETSLDAANRCAADRGARRRRRGGRPRRARGPP